MMHPARRLADQKLLARVRRSVAEFFTEIGRIAGESDMRLVLLLGGSGLLAWAVMGVCSERGRQDLIAYAAMFPMGSPRAWIAVYVGAGLAMIWLAYRRVPKVPALLLGPVLIAVWSWAFFARVATIATFQTGNATSLIYMTIGALLIYNVGSRK